MKDENETGVNYHSDSHRCTLCTLALSLHPSSLIKPAATHVGWVEDRRGRRTTAADRDNQMHGWVSDNYNYRRSVSLWCTNKPLIKPIISDPLTKTWRCYRLWLMLQEIKTWQLSTDVTWLHVKGTRKSEPPSTCMSHVKRQKNKDFNRLVGE